MMAATVIVAAPPAAAHTGFGSSDPADGTVVEGPVTEVVITFTGAAAPVDGGFAVRDGDGTVRSPTAIETVDGTTFTLAFQPALAAGMIGVRWSVQAADAHPIDGSFSFTIVAPDPSPSVALAPPATAAPVPPATATPETVAPETLIEGRASASDGTEGITLAEFLETDSSSPGKGRRLVGRVVSFFGVIGAVGGLVFLAWTLRGSQREIVLGVATVGVLGGATAGGAALEYWGTVSLPDERLIEAWTSSPGLAAVLRMVGGVAVAFGAAGATARRSTPVPQSLSAATRSPTSFAGPRAAREWDPRAAPLAFAGAGTLLTSFWFDGHTVSDGPRLLHAALDTTHVAAAAIWAGGLFAMTAIVWRRTMRGERTHAAELVARFSGIAALALALVAAAGVAMATFVLDSPREIISTEWGRTLAAKTTVVAIAALAGGYNHFRLRPALEVAPDDPRLIAEMRASITLEALLVAAAIAVSAYLVSAAT